jgi:hypothetical protein
MRAIFLSLLIASVLTACGGGTDTTGNASGAAAQPAAVVVGDDSVKTTLKSAVTGQRWSDPKTWGGTVPPAGAAVVIPAGQTVLLDMATPPLRGLTVEGTLVADDTDVAITTDMLIVRGGRFSIGTAAAPFARRATITLTGSTTADLPGAAGFGAKVLGVMGGVLELNGKAGVSSWTRLSGADTAAGVRRITVDSAAGWQAGDRIVIATSSADMQAYDLAEITAVNGNAVDLAAPLKHAHFGTVRQIGNRPIDVRAEVGRLSRNIVVQGDAASEASKVGGHAMFMASDAGASVQIAGVEFARMGQLDKLGRYPLHFHLMGAGCKGCYVKDSAVRDSIQRGIVVHGTQGIALTGNVVFNTVGHNIVIEDETSTGNRIEKNLALVNRQPSPLHTEPTLVSQEDRMPSNYWIKSALNTVANNSAAGSFFNGFNYAGIDGGEDDARVGNPIDFRDNTAHAAMAIEGAGAGDFDITGGLLILSEARRPANDRIENLLAYHNQVGVWPEKASDFVIQGLVAVENQLHLENRGVGNQVRVKNSLFVAKLPGSTAAPSRLAHIQYGSDVVLEGSTFAGWDTLGFEGTDTGPTQASFKIAGAQFVGAKPRIGLTDLATQEFADDTMLPRGFYVPVNARWLSTPQCSTAAIDADTAEPNYSTRCPQRLRYAELEVRDRLNSAFADKVDPYLVRNDGLRYRRQATPETAGQATGSHGATVIYGEASLQYRIEAPASANGWALRLSDAAIASASPDLRADAAWVAVAVPVAAAPRGVYRTGLATDQPDPPSPASALAAASSLAQHLANPKRSYFYDSAKGVVHAHAGAQWLIVSP